MTLRPWSTRVMIAAAVVSLLLLAGSLAAQRRFPFREETVRNTPYDGRFTFVRLRYTPAPGGYWAGPSWLHGYPVAEESLLRIMREITFLDMHADETNVLTLNDPELFHYPIAYIIEVGWWAPTPQEAVNLGAYLRKGGFLIVDDFKPEGWRGVAGGGWEPFVEAMKRVLPGARIVDLDHSHPIFHSFFEIPNSLLDDFPQAYNFGRPVFRGIYEDNDPRKRLMVMINYNTDVSQYWEWSGRGLRPFEDTNEAYKLGVNYMTYGLTH